MYQNLDLLPFKKEINLFDLLMYIIKKWYILVSIVTVFVVTSVIYYSAIVTPLYSSTAKMYITNKNSQTITSSDLSVSIYLSNDFAEIILDTPVLDKVCDELDNKFTPEEIK